jgi:predicted RNase H-like HicB family nuclease
MNMIDTIHAVIRRGEKYFVCECVEIPVVTQGKTLDEISANLEDIAALGIEAHPAISVTFEWEPAYA